MPMSSDAVSRNVGDVLALAAQRAPLATALLVVSPTGDALLETVTYEALDARAKDVAACLIARGIGPGDTVALCMPNSSGLVATWFGAAYAGATIVPLSTRLTPHEVKVRCDFASVVMTLTEEPVLTVVDAESHAIDIKRPEFPIRLAVEATAMLLYTSGTTGAPKAACIGHASLLTHTRALVDHVLGLEPTDRVLAVLPMSHSYGCRMTLLASFMAGATTVVLSHFSARGSLRAIRDYDVSWCPAVPTMFAAWAALPVSPFPSDRLRWCLSAGASLSEPTRRGAEAVLGCEIRQGYGMTEATFAAIDCPPALAQPGSVGRPVPGVDIRVTPSGGADGGRPGAVGQIEVRGPNVMQRYLLAPQATVARIVNGWVQTGDLGTLDADGRLRITGRQKDVVICGGITVYPAEVEEALGAVAGVNDVAVVGRPDAFYGETVCAVVAGPPSLQDALERTAGSHLSPEKRPTAYAFVTALPQGASGKVLKRALNEALDAKTLAIVPIRSEDSN